MLEYPRLRTRRRGFKAIHYLPASHKYRYDLRVKLDTYGCFGIRAKLAAQSGAHDSIIRLRSRSVENPIVH